MLNMSLTSVSDDNLKIIVYDIKTYYY